MENFTPEEIMQLAVIVERSILRAERRIGDLLGDIDMMLDQSHIFKQEERDRKAQAIAILRARIAVEEKLLDKLNKND